MRDEELIYVPRGYEIAYETRARFRGYNGSLKELYHARKDGKKYFVFSDRQGDYIKIQEHQDSIPHMARFSEPAGGFILMDEARGQLVWHIDELSENQIAAIESQLIEFAAATKANQLQHNDLKPWNIFIGENSRITMIDWDRCKLGKDADLEFDLEDAQRSCRVMRGEMDFQAAWGWTPTWHPKWCKQAKAT